MSYHRYAIDWRIPPQSEHMNRTGLRLPQLVNLVRRCRMQSTRKCPDAEIKDKEGHRYKQSTNTIHHFMFEASFPITSRSTDHRLRIIPVSRAI